MIVIIILNKCCSVRKSCKGSVLKQYFICCNVSSSHILIYILYVATVWMVSAWSQLVGDLYTVQYTIFIFIFSISNYFQNRLCIKRQKIVKCKISLPSSNVCATVWNIKIFGLVMKTKIKPSHLRRWRSRFLVCCFIFCLFNYQLIDFIERNILSEEEKCVCVWFFVETFETNCVIFYCCLSEEKCDRKFHVTNCSELVWVDRGLTTLETEVHTYSPVCASDNKQHGVWIHCIKFNQDPWESKQSNKAKL